MSIYGEDMTDAEYEQYIYSLPRWQRRCLFTITFGTFGAMFVVMALGMCGVIH